MARPDRPMVARYSFNNVHGRLPVPADGAADVLWQFPFGEYLVVPRRIKGHCACQEKVNVGEPDAQPLGQSQGGLMLGTNRMSHTNDVIRDVYCFTL